LRPLNQNIWKPRITDLRKVTYQFTIQLTEEHIKYAARRFCFKVCGKAVLALLLLTAIAFVLNACGQPFNRLADAVLGMVGFTAVLFFFLYVMLLKKRLSLFKKYGGTVNYEFSEELFKSKSGWASLEAKWEAFQAICVFPKTWMLTSRNIGYFTFPVDQTTDEAKEFLKQKIISVGGKIK
jgi:hypothetical protein